MASFSFASNPTTTTGPSFSFGSNPGQLGSLDASGNPAAAAAGSLSFRAPTPGGLTFGTNVSAPPTSFAATGIGAGGGGLNFKGPGSMGVTGAAQPTGGLTFGNSGAQPATGFGLAAAPTSTANTGLSFFNSATPTVGAVAAPSFNFGATTPAQTTAGTGSLLLGSNVPTAQTGGLGLMGAATPTPGLTPASAAATCLIAPSAASTTKTPTVSFGMTPTTSVAVVAPSVTPAVTSTSTGVSFGFPAAAKTTTTGFTLNTSVPSTGSTGIFGSFASTTASSAAATTTGVTSTAATTLFKGLGGVDTTQSLGSLGGVGAVGSGMRPDSKSAKENQVPNDILVSIEEFKSFVKNQKNLSCEVARASVKPMAKVTDDTQALHQLLFSLSTDVQRNNFLVERLKANTSKLFAQCEMAQRTHDTPAGLQNDNTVPLEFFVSLASGFEHSVQLLRLEINNTEKHVNALSQPSVLTPQDLSMSLKRLHESFVALAGRLQVVHQTVVQLKERHLSLRRHFLKDSSDIFAKPTGNLPKKNGSFAGPTPFSALGAVQSLGMMATQDKMISSFPSGASSVPGWGATQTTTPMPAMGTGSNLFSPGSFGSPTADSSNFQLLKPPPGNKRGKR